MREEDKVGGLLASALAAALGWALFRLAARAGDGSEPDRPEELDPPVDEARDHIRGRFDAPLTLVEYGDFECPFCGEATGTVAELRERFGSDLRYVFRHLPLRDVHPHAALAAQAAEAAGAQAASGRCTTCSSPAKTRWSSTTSSPTPPSSAWTCRAFAPTWGTPTASSGCRRTSTAPRPAAWRARRRSSSVGGASPGAIDADGLAAALERARGAAEMARAPRAREEPGDDG